MKLTEFLIHWHEGTEGLLKEFDPDNLDWMTDSNKYDFCETFGESEPRSLSVSKLYKPLLFHLLERDFSIHDEFPSALQSRYHVFQGKYLETMLVSLMYQYGVDIHSLQKEVQFAKGICGHIDFIYSDNTVVDIKSMSPSYFQRFTKEPDDNRGYITQILAYRAALGVKYAGILCLNKLTGELYYQVVNDDTEIHKDNYVYDAVECLERAYKIVDAYYETPKKELHELLVSHQLPEPYNHPATFKMIVPESIQWDSRTRAFYNFDLRTRYIKHEYEFKDKMKFLLNSNNEL